MLLEASRWVPSAVCAYYTSPEEQSSQGCSREAAEVHCGGTLRLYTFIAPLHLEQHPLQLFYILDFADELEGALLRWQAPQP